MRNDIWDPLQIVDYNGTVKQEMQAQTSCYMDKGVRYQNMYMSWVTGSVGNVPFRIEWNHQGRDASLDYLLHG